MPENNNNCPSCLEDLMRPSACEKTLGGMVTEFLYGYKSDVQTWPQKQSAALRTGLVDHVETVNGSNMVMKPGKRMFRIQVKKGSAELKYEVQGESGAKSFKASLESNIPGFRSAILGFMTATINQELVVLAKTRAGEWHLLGDEDEGVEYDSGTANSGKTGTEGGLAMKASGDCAMDYGSREVGFMRGVEDTLGQWLVVGMYEYAVPETLAHQTARFADDMSPTMFTGEKEDMGKNSGTA